MNKAQSYGFLNWALTAYFMSFLKTATAQLLLSLVVPLVTLSPGILSTGMDSPVMTD